MPWNRALRVGIAGLVVALLPDAGRAESYEVDGGRVEVRLVPDWPSAMVGEPLYVSLAIENLTDRDVLFGDGWTRNAMGRPDFVELATIAEDGTVLEVPDPGPSFGGKRWVRKIAPGERHVHRLFLPHWAVFREPGTYTLRCRRSYDFFAEADDPQRHRPPARSVPVDLSAQLVIRPANPAAVPAMIERWSRLLRTSNHDAASEAARALAHVDDPRVIPALVSGIQKGNYDILSTCLRALSKFDHDEALHGIRLGLAATADTFSRQATTPEGAAGLVKHVRHTAAIALAESRHPKAGESLLSLRRDAQSDIRLTVVHALGARRAPEDVAMLREMASDEDAVVRGEVERYLALAEGK
jgi:hypothetical protein